MASYDLKAILGEKLKRLTEKTLKALVDCMCAVGASLCSLDKRVSALESVEIPEGGYKPMQEPVASPSASGTAIQFIESVSQDATGRMTATKKTVRTGSTSQTGVLRLTDSHTSTSTTTAATPKNVKEAYDLAYTANTGAVKNVAYDSTNKKITKTINGTKSDVVSVATLKTDMALNNVDNTSDTDKPVSTAQQTALDLKQPSRLVVSSDDKTAFSKISAAITAGKDVWLNTNATYSGATYSHYVPLTEAVFRSGAYTAFIFSRSRAYSDENGIVDRWTCNSSGWTYETESVAYAATAGTAGTAGTANSASNANLGKTTDATNGDLLYIGGGTQQRVTNAAHANSAKDYDQTGSIATALASKQPTVVFYGTSTGGTLSDPAISKSYLDTFKDTYVRCYARNFADTYDGLTGAVLSTIEMGGQRILDELFIIATNRDGGKAQVNDKGVSRKIVAIGNMYTGGDTNAQKTEYTLKPNRPYNGSPYNGHSIPVYEDGWRKNVIFELTINNTDVSPEKIYLESGGAYHVGASSYAHYTQSQIIIDGVIYGTSGNPTEWSDNYRYKVAIGSVPAGGSRTWQIVWWSVKPGDTVTLPTGSYTYYEKEFVVVTTIK